MKQHKRNCFKVRWGIFSFFSSTNVETKNVCPIAYNVLRLMAGGFYRRLVCATCH